jgi:hypothetical protein
VVVIAAGLVALGVFGYAFQESQPVQPPTPARSEPAARDDVPEPGIQLIVRPLPDGTLDVTEIATLQRPITRLVLAVPSAVHAGTAFAHVRLITANLQVTADGRRVPSVPVALRGRVDLPLPRAVKRLELRYRLVGGTVRSTPAPAGRALAITGPLTAPLDGSLPTGLTVSGGGVRNLVCPLLPPDRRLCANSTAMPLTVRAGLAAKDATIIMQLDLPA